MQNMDHSVVKYLLVSLNMCCLSNSNITVISISSSWNDQQTIFKSSNLQS